MTKQKKTLYSGRPFQSKRRVLLIITQGEEGREDQDCQDDCEESSDQAQDQVRVDTLTPPAHDGDVNAVAFIDSATHILASGGDDGVCKIWDRRALRETDPVPVGLLAGHIDGITYIDPKGDGRHLITNRQLMLRILQIY